MESRSATLHFDLDKLKDVAIRSVRRAATFLGIGINSTSDWHTQTLTLQAQSMWRFVPDPLPEGFLEHAVYEFRTWIAANALRELDAGFNTFLDQAWNILAWSKLHGTRVKSDHTIKGIEADTNAASKYEKVITEAGAQPHDLPELKSLSNLRNCLTHSHGVVTSRHLNTDKALLVQWKGFEMRLQQEDVYVVFPCPMPEQGIQAPDPSKPAQVVGVVVSREKRFEVSKPVALEPSELHEICWGYLRRTDEVTDAILADMRKRGISAPGGANPESGMQPVTGSST